jgi:hypothetical protein
MSAAMLLIQYLNGLYRERSLVSAVPVLANLIIPAVGVFLFMKSLYSAVSDKPMNLGKALFGSLMVSVLIALCNVAAYQHVLTGQPAIVQDLTARNHSAIEKHFAAPFQEADDQTPVSEEERLERIEEAKANFQENMSIGSFARAQFMMCLSLGMVVSLLVYVRNQGKGGQS